MVRWFSWFRSKPNELQTGHTSANSVPTSEPVRDTTGDINPVTTRKYEHPKILLLDLDDDVVSALADRGFNAVAGSLGTPYTIKPQQGFVPVNRACSLPFDFKEFEIIVIDLHYNLDRTASRQSANVEVDSVKYMTVSAEDGYVNPRIINGYAVRPDFNRILNAGGVFIVFAHALEAQNFRVYDESSMYLERPEKLDNYSFLSVTANSILIGDGHGVEMTLSDNAARNSALGIHLAGHLGTATYSCTVRPSHNIDNEWITLLQNKYEEPVAGLLLPQDDGQGCLLVLPNIKDKVSLLTYLIEEYLPGVAPRLFPEYEQASWAHLPEYELPEIRSLKEEIAGIQDRAKSEVAALEQQIQGELEANKYLFDLVRGTGDELVDAVQKSLSVLGFSNIVDVDQQLRNDGINRQNREDLQIRDNEPILIVEVKGVSGLPTYDDALAVERYVVLRTREWDRTDVRGLSIINHQRNLPPLDRDNAAPFRQEIVEVAAVQSIGLFTAWDLHRLVRSFLKNQWEHRHIRDLFYGSCRIDPVPKHYAYVGVVEKYIEKLGVVGIKVDGTTFRLGDRLAFELPVIFEEQICESLQHDNQTIGTAEFGMVVGLKTNLSKQQARPGVRVFRVMTESDTDS